MPISAHWLLPARLLALDPDVAVRVEHSQAAVVLLAIVATEDIQLALVESRRVVLDLGSLSADLG